MAPGKRKVRFEKMSQSAGVRQGAGHASPRMETSLSAKIKTLLGPVAPGSSGTPVPLPSASPPPYGTSPGRRAPQAGPPSPTPPPQTPLPGYADLSPRPPRYTSGSNSAASDDSAGDPTDCDEAATWRRYGQCIPLLQPHCVGPDIAPREQVTMPHPFTVCHVCRAKNLNGDAGPPVWESAVDSVNNSFTHTVYQHIGDPVPSWQLMDNMTTTGIPLGAPVPAHAVRPFQHGVQAILCRYCQDDEILHWRRKKQSPDYLAANPPHLNSAAGADNECVCSAVVLLPYYCRMCSIKALTRELWTATTNAYWLHRLARDRNGQRVAADATLQQNRQTRKQWLACRCGREAPKPVRHPSATFCLRCEGVMIHIAGQIAGNTDLASRLRVNWARPLNNLRANHPLWSSGGAIDRAVPAVRRSNNGA